MLLFSESLRDAAHKRGRFFGAAINAGVLSNKTESAYRAVAAQQYNLVTPENACKWGATEKEQGKFTFVGCDEVLNYTLHTMKGTFRGHNLCWGNYNPSWLENLSASEKKPALVNHIQAMFRHYGGKPYAWDVVNEAIADGGSDPMKHNTWYPDVPDYIDVAFKTARAADPSGGKVKLFYNDYNIAFGGTKSDRVLDLVKGMQNRSVPIDGVGIQMHLKGPKDLDLSGLKSFMQSLAALGLEVHITEMDISFDVWGDQEEKEQAKMYADVLSVCLDVPACKSFETWGFTDAHTWRGTSKHPLPFDEHCKPKAAVQSMLDVLTGSPSPPSIVAQ
eukprot:TRINITY_DN3923_c0_g1_i1.p1 TRINITY_DN3923_c0_g1~~TRINITY_DN3923_c0_g1_i1.p1  ORF type:complete len:333 (+),score=113.59 TRINITY_DN3923_c0_g1_i1:152-1150(+)